MASISHNLSNKYWQYAVFLALFTILYNFAEGIISIYFGLSDEALTLFGFGVDSFIEVMSGFGILAMVYRIRMNPNTPRTQFEKTALRITGTAFYLLCAGLAASAIYNVLTEHKPVTTIPGLVISVVSIGLMWLLVTAKRKTGKALNSAPILADANCTVVCIYMSIVLLLSSIIYKFTGFAFSDTLGAFGLIYFSFNEGKEAFKKAAGMACSCDDHCSN